MALGDRVVVDLELGRGFGYGLADIPISGFAVAVTWSDTDGFVHWNGTQGRQLLDYLLQHREVVGFNVLSYDNLVMSGYLLDSERHLVVELKQRTVDLHALLYQATGRRYGLDVVARQTLGEGKVTPPVDDDAMLLAEYCERDVALTRDLDAYRRAFGVLYVVDGQPVALPSGDVLKAVLPTGTRVRV